MFKKNYHVQDRKWKLLSWLNSLELIKFTWATVLWFFEEWAVHVLDVRPFFLNSGSSVATLPVTCVQASATGIELLKVGYILLRLPSAARLTAAAFWAFDDQGWGSGTLLTRLYPSFPISIIIMPWWNDMLWLRLTVNLTAPAASTPPRPLHSQ